VPIVANTEGVTDLAVPLNKGARITGRLEFDGQSTRPTPEQMNGAFLTVWSDFREFSPALIETSGRIRTAGLIPGRYVLRSSTCRRPVDPPGTRSRSRSMGATWRTHSSTSPTLDISDVVITLTDRPASVAGTVRNQRGNPVPEAVVVAFPVDRALRDTGSISLWRVKQVAASLAGAYSIRPVVPGEYFLVAATEGITDRWTDPAVLQALESAATRVKLADGETAQRDLVAITALPSRGGAARGSSATSGPLESEVDTDDDGLGHGEIAQ
jgi:hypothetical protein